MKKNAKNSIAIIIGSGTVPEWVLKSPRRKVLASVFNSGFTSVEMPIALCPLGRYTEKKVKVGEPESIILIPTASTILNVGEEAWMSCNSEQE